MSVSRTRRGRSSRRSPSERRKTTLTIRPAQRRFLRELLHVLAEIVDERANGDDLVAELDEDSKPKNEDNHVNGGKQGMIVASRKRDTRGREGSQNKRLPYEISSVARFKKLSETHGQLTDQIRSSLNALGGGARTAGALESMHKCISSAANRIIIDNDTTCYIFPYECAEKLFACRGSGPEVRDAFYELGVFNANFFGALERIIHQFEAYKTISAELHAEYGPTLFSTPIAIDEYLDSIFEPLTRDFEVFINALTKIAEKDIPALRQTQNFSSQRFLMLTTIATFLSSVTATTLQITADDAISYFTRMTNTTWFISLVFSTASAVYSLLVMTWRQSSVVQPDKALPSFLSAWFRDGPMYTLIAALISFSIGLCLLPFRVGDHEGLHVSAVVPVACAGVHACAIVLFSAWFLFVKGRLPLHRVKATVGRLISTYDTISSAVKGHASRVAQQLWKSLTSIQTNRLNPDQCLSPGGKDVELGEGVVDTVAQPSSSAYTDPDGLANAIPSPITSDNKMDEDSVPEAPESERVLAVPGIAATSERGAGSHACDQPEKTMHRPLEKLLDFSPDYKFLAFARDDTVTIYKMGDTYSVLEILKAPNADEVKGISWSFRLKLLVRSRRSVSVWMVGRKCHLSGYLNESVISAHWTTEDIAETEGIMCIVGSTIRFFNVKCEEIPGRSIDVSKLHNVNRVIDAALVCKTCLLCIADVPEDRGHSRLLVINVDSESASIRNTHRIHPGHTSITVSLASNRVLILGSEYGAEIADLSIPGSHGGGDKTIITSITSLYDQTLNGEKLRRPEKAVTFYGNREQILIGYSEGEIVALIREPGDGYFSSLHIFTAPDVAALPKKPIGFAVHRGLALPYMFTFADEDGRVTIWSVQSNSGLDECRSAETFEVHDHRGGRFFGEERVITGKFLVLSPSATSLVETVDD